MKTVSADTALSLRYAVFGNSLSPPPIHITIWEYKNGFVLSSLKIIIQIGYVYNCADLEIYASGTHIKHIYRTSTSTNFHSEEEKSINPKSIQKLSNQYISWENAKGEYIQNSQQNCLNFFFPILSFPLCDICSSYLSSHDKVPCVHSSNHLVFYYVGLVLYYVVSVDCLVYSSQQKKAQELPNGLLFRRKYLKHK